MLFRANQNAWAGKILKKHFTIEIDSKGSSSLSSHSLIWLSRRGLGAYE